jgi:Tol biopolymer transport system component
MVTVNPRPAWLGRSVLAFVLLAAGSSPGWTQQIQVNSADPNTAPQGTINLDVLVKGRGFKPGARARWLVTGTTEPGGVTVNSTTVLSGTEIRANITIAAGAVVSFYDIDVMNADGRTGKGTERFSVTQGKPAAEPPPDPAIVYIDNSQLMVMNADGTNKRVVWGAARDVSRAPDWSPDATQLVFVRQPARKSPGLFLINLDGSGLCQLATLRESSNLLNMVRPAWSPLPLADGQYWIVYQDNTVEPMSGGGTRRDLYAVRASCANPGTPVRLTNDDEDAWFGWSPLADRLVVAYGDYASHVVYDVVISSGRPTLVNPVTYAEWGGSVLDPSWAKNSDRIIFSRPDSPGGWYDLFVAEPGQAAVQITSTPEMGGEIYPDWSPDGSEIVFVTMANETNTMSAVWKLGWVVGADGIGRWIRTQKLLDIFGQPMPRWRRCSVCP